MSQIDSRVVEMRFDNKQFEAGAKETMGTLGRLKEALKLPETGKALEGLDKATKNISLDGIAAGVDALNKRFSTLGIVGMRIIENITDGLMNKLNTAVNFVTNSIVSGGIKRAMNIENAHFQLQFLLKDEAKVQAVMADAMESVDGTAYAYDEAAKAASQFAASGIQAGDDMLNSLKGITGVAAMTNSSFEDISRVFTTVAGNGRLMGDQLLQLSSRGLNAASTMVDYFKEVRGQSNITESEIRTMVSKGQISFKDFSDAMTWAFGDSAKRANETFTGSLSNIKSALARIGAGFVSPLVEQNGELVQLFNALRIKINDVKASLVFDEQRSAVSGLAEATGMTTDELNEMFKSIKSNGKVTAADMDTLVKKGANAGTALTRYINGVSDGSIRANYAIKSTVDELTNGTKVSIMDVRRFVDEGKIDLSMFTSAMETEFGKEKTLSKQFTDFFLDHIHMIVVAINNADMTKPMEAFNHLVESTKNVAKGLLSVLTPMGKAFAEVFLSFNADDVVQFSAAIERLTSKMKLSERGSQNLHDAMKGLFSVVKLVIDGFFKLVSAIIPINKPIIEAGGGFLDLAGSMGRALTSFTEMIRSSTLLKRAFEAFSSAVSMGIGGLSSMIKIAKDFIGSLLGLVDGEEIINGIGRAFENLGLNTAPYVKRFVTRIKEIFKALFNIEGIDLDFGFESISNAFKNFASIINGLSFENIQISLDTLKNKVSDFLKVINSNEGLAIFVANAKKYGEELKEAFTWDNLMDRLEKIMEVFGKFFNWIKETAGPVFEDFTVGEALATGGGFGIIYALIKATKAFENISRVANAIPDLLGGIKGTLVAYQKELKAEAILKLSAAIAVLAGALVLLSFADTDRLGNAAVALALVAGTLTIGISKLLDALNKGKELNNATRIFTKAINNFGRSLMIKSIGSAIKDFGKSIVLIAGSIVALALMYRKDKESMTDAIELVTIIGIVLAAVMAVGSIAGKFAGSGMKNFSSLLTSIAALSAGLLTTVTALNKLFKMTLPADWETKLGILAGIMLGMAGIALVLGIAGRIAGGGSATALGGAKIPFITAMFGGNISSNGGSVTAAPILALAAMLYTTVAALDKLFKMNLPSDWETKVTIMAGIFVGLSALMIAMGAASKLAGGAIKSAGTILALCVMIGTVTAALMVLTIIPGDKMLKGVTSLGLILVALGAALYGAGKVTSAETYKSVLAMAIAVGAITAALGVLSMVPLSGIAKSAAALGSILLILAVDLDRASKTTNNNAWISVGAMIAAVITISYSLYKLAEQPWSGILAGAVGLSAVLLSMSGSMAIISSANPNPMAIAAFLAASVSIGLIALSIYELSKQPWENLLGAASSLSLVLVALSAAMAISSVAGAAAGPALVGIALLDTFIANFAFMLMALGQVYDSEEARALMNGGIQFLTQLGYAIGSFVGAIVEGVLTQVSGALPAIGQGLSGFIENLQPFIAGSRNIDEQVLKGIGILAACIIAITAAEVISGVGFFMGGASGLVSMALNLVTFIIALNPFLTAIRGIDQGAVEATKMLAEMIMILTAANLLSGIAKFFGISGSISDFGKELSEFGPHIKKFADDVKDVKPEAVQGAASAAEIMANMAKKLPGTGGLAQKIFGEKSISEFGKELVKFGPAIKEFADTVKDVQPAAVQGAASAAEIMANLATKLPSQGGLAQKIFGEKSISEFGKELVKFGPNIVEFANQVRSVNPSAISGATSVTTIMTELANNLPSTQSLWNKIFGGGQATISQFGQELIKFGNSMVTFTATIAGVKTTNINSTITSFKSLADLSGYIEGKDATNIVKFADSLNKTAVNAIDKFVNTFSNSRSKVSPAIKNFYKNVDNEINTSSINLAKTMETRGGQIVDGLDKGLKNNQKRLSATVTTIAKSIDTALCKTLDIHSPSKLGETRGGQWNEGVTEGLSKTASSVKTASTNVGKTLSDSFGSVLDTGIKDVTKKLDGMTEENKSFWGSYVKTGKDGVEENKKEVLDVMNSTSKTSFAKTQEIHESQLTAEEAYWNKLLEIKKSGEESEKYSSMDMNDFRKDILEQTNDIYNNYVEKFKSTRDSLVSSMSIFSEVKEQEEVLGKHELEQNLRDQINLYEEYTDILSSLNERIDGTALIEELRNLGVDSTDQLRVINSMTDEELTHYADLYDQKMEAASLAAVQQLAGLQQETEAQLNQLFGGMYTQVDLFDFGKVFDGSIESLRTYIGEIYVPMEEVGQKTQEMMSQIGENITGGLETGLEGASSTMSEKLTSILTETFNNQTESTTSMSSDLGKNITDGIAEGLTSDTSTIQASATDLINGINNYLKEAGEIHSPSELTKREVGAMLTEGIAAGMVENLAPIAESAKTIIDTLMNDLTSQAEALKKVGSDMIDGVITGINAKKPLALSTITNLTTAMINQFKISLTSTTFNTFGQNIVQALVTGINSKKPLAQSTVKNLCTTIINEFRTSLPNSTFNTFGQNIVAWIIQGMESKRSEAVSTASQISTSIIEAFRSTLTQDAFREIGANAALGLKYGIESKIDEIAESARRAAREAIREAKEELDEHSPSRVAFGMGEFFSIGLANGILNKVKAIGTASSKAASEAVNVTKDVVNGVNTIIDSDNFNIDPVIRPVMDLSDVERGFNEIESMMRRTYNLSSVYDRVLEASASFNMGKTTSSVEERSKSNSSDGGNTFEFIQNNYSPKALTRSEIYRNTQNQFSAFKRVVNPS